MKLRKFNIIDLEATCIEDPASNPDFISEIIEIGIVQIELPSRQILLKESILVKPKHSTITPYCTELTTLTAEKVKFGRTMEAAFEHLKERFSTRAHPWGSWGSYDYFMFNKMSKLYDIPNPMSTKHINIKLLFALYHQLSKELNVQNALDHLKLSFEGTPHRGVDDAINIKKLYDTFSDNSKG